MRVRELTAEDLRAERTLAALVELRQRVIGHPEPEFDSRLRWLLANPHGENLWLLCEDQSRITGMMNFMPQPVAGRGRRFMSALAMLALTDPQAQKQGIYSRLTSRGLALAAERGIPVCIGYTMLDYVLRAELRSGWTALGHAKMLVFPHQPAAIANKLGMPPAIARLCGVATDYAVLAWLRRRVERASRGGSYTFRTVQHFGADYDRLADHNVGAPRYDIEKRATHLNWKYLGDPATRDRSLIVEARLGPDLVGAIVLRFGSINRFEGAVILDMLAPWDHQQALAPLLAHTLVQYVLPLNPDLVGCLVSSEMPEYRILRRVGFVDSRKRLTFIFKQTTPELPADAQQWAHWVNLMGNNDNV